MFMGPCIVSIFQYTSNKMKRYTVYIYLETALHVWGGTATPSSGAHTIVDTVVCAPDGGGSTTPNM